MAKDVQDLATHLDWGSYHLIGASMGGMIAQELAILSPERILSLSLLSTHSGWGSTTVKGIYHLLMGMVATDAETRFANVGAMLFPSGFLETDAPGGFVPKVLEEKEGGYTMADVFRDREMHVATKVPRPTLKAIRAQGMCTHKLMPVLAILSHYVSPTRLAIIRDASFPVLVATGTEDLLVGAGNSTYLSEACGGTLRVFDGIGHSLAFQACEELNGVLHGHFGREVGMGKLGVGMSNIVLL
jgi:3-oxoadipate enol-lactonase